MDGGSGVGRASGATGLNKIIKRLKEFPRSPTCPGYPFPSLSMPSTLAAILRRILKREREREREGEGGETDRERNLDDEEDFAQASKGGWEERGRKDSEGPVWMEEAERWRLAPGGFFVRQ